MIKVLKNAKKDCYMINANSENGGWILVKEPNVPIEGIESVDVTTLSPMYKTSTTHPF
jgi:hypothetical protein